VEWATTFAGKLKKLGARRIVFVGPVPHWSADLPKLVVRDSWPPAHRTFTGINKSVLESNAKLQLALQAEPMIQFANVIDTLCNDDGCSVYFGEDVARGIVSWDDAHLTPIASDYVARTLLVPIIIGAR
jgi:hypothetical protein